MPKPEHAPVGFAATSATANTTWKDNAARARLFGGCSTCGAEAAYAIHAYDEATACAGLVRLACEKHRAQP